MILSVKKATDMLDCIALKGRISIKDIGRQLGMPRSTVYRLARTLQAAGYIEHDDITGDCSLSYKFFRIGYDILEKLGVRDCVMPVLRRLYEISRETVSLTILEENRVLYIEKIETDFINTELRVGKRAPLHCTAPGIAMLASLPQERVNSILETCVPLEAYTEKTTVTVEGLLKQIEECRQRGYAVCKDEIANGVYAIGAAVQGYPGREAAALSIAGPSNRFTLEKVSSTAEFIIDACAELSRKFKA